MSPTNTTGRPAYKVEELLALRASASDSRVSLDKFPDEEVIKDKMSGRYVYKEKGMAEDTRAKKMEWVKWTLIIDEVERAQIMYKMYGRATVTDPPPPPLEHVLKQNPNGDYETRTENLPPSTCIVSSDGHNNGNGGNHAPAFRPRYQGNNFAAAGPSGTNKKRPSPTPSVKKNKVEELIKQHGSPPHVRVTAGGRIVPNDLQQLGSPRFAHTPVYTHPHSGRMVAARPNGMGQGNLQNGFIAYNATQDLVQWVDGQWERVFIDRAGLPKYRVAPANTFPLANNVFNSVIERNMPPYMPPYYQSGPQSFGSFRPPALINAVPEDIDEQIAANEAEYKRVSDEHKELNRYEVTNERTLNSHQKTDVINRKREYVKKLDEIYKHGKYLKALKNGGEGASASGSSTLAGPNVSTFPLPMYSMGGYDGAGGAMPGQPFSAYPGGPATMIPAPLPYGMPWTDNFNPANTPGGTAFQAAESSRHAQAAMDPPTSEPSPSSRAQGRRSHAVEIRAPNKGHYHLGPEYPMMRKTQSTGGEHPSNLNPASPSYEPGKPYPLTEGSPPHFVVPAPTPIETPNPPPAELAKHWVFSQQQVHRQHAHVHAQMLSNHNMHDRLPADINMIHNMNGRLDGNMGAGVAHHHQELANGNGNDGLLGGGHVDTNRSSNDADNERSSQRPNSHSSVTTTDFFPTNTHEHSFNKYMSRKTSAAQRLSMEANPCTPMRDPQSGVVSPMTDHIHPPAPPVSPAAQYGVPPHLLANSPEDMRLSSFLRDTARVPTQTTEEQIPQHSPVRPETRDEFHGKSRPYLEGYLAGSSGHAPAEPKNAEYCTGYIDGLSKMCLGAATATRESSTVSLKSETISVSRTPPNTTDNRSLIAELAGTAPNRGENVRLTQSLNFSSPPSGSNHPGNEPTSNGTANHAPGASYPSGDTQGRVASGYNLAGSSHLPRSWSEDTGAPSKNGFNPSTGPWNVPTHHPKVINNDFALQQPQAATITSSHAPSAAAVPGAYTVNRRSDRMVSTSIASHPSLTGYSGNQAGGARVGSIPQLSVFGDDKYVVTTTTTTIEANKTATTAAARYPLHENQRSISTTVSRNSQYDGAMDDLAEMKAPGSCAAEAAKHQKNTSSVGTGCPNTNPGANTPRTTKHSATATPSGSPTKSTSSPKKVTSPRHRFQQIKEKVGDYLDRSSGGYCGSGGVSGEQSRSESPDPKHMSPEEKKRWKDGWRHKLGVAKAKEDVEVKKWRRESGNIEK